MGWILGSLGSGLELTAFVLYKVYRVYGIPSVGSQDPREVLPRHHVVAVAGTVSSQRGHNSSFGLTQRSTVHSRVAREIVTSVTYQELLDQDVVFQIEISLQRKNWR